MGKKFIFYGGCFFILFCFGVGNSLSADEDIFKNNRLQDMQNLQNLGTLLSQGASSFHTSMEVADVYGFDMEKGGDLIDFLEAFDVGKEVFCMDEGSPFWARHSKFGFYIFRSEIVGHYMKSIGRFYVAEENLKSYVLDFEYITQGLKEENRQAVNEAYQPLLNSALKRGNQKNVTLFKSSFTDIEEIYRRRIKEDLDFFEKVRVVVKKEVKDVFHLFFDGNVGDIKKLFLGLDYDKDFILKVIDGQKIYVKLTKFGMPIVRMEIQGEFLAFSADFYMSEDVAVSYVFNTHYNRAEYDQYILELLDVDVQKNMADIFINAFEMDGGGYGMYFDEVEKFHLKMFSNELNNRVYGKFASFYYALKKSGKVIEDVHLGFGYRLEKIKHVFSQGVFETEVIKKGKGILGYQMFVEDKESIRRKFVDYGAIKEKYFLDEDGNTKMLIEGDVFVRQPFACCGFEKTWAGGFETIKKKDLEDYQFLMSPYGNHVYGSSKEKRSRFENIQNDLTEDDVMILLRSLNPSTRLYAAEYVLKNCKNKEYKQKVQEILDFSLKGTRGVFVDSTFLDIQNMSVRDSMYNRWGGRDCFD